MRIARTPGVSKEIAKPRRGMSLRPKLPEPVPPSKIDTLALTVAESMESANSVPAAVAAIRRMCITWPPQAPRASILGVPDLIDDDDVVPDVSVIDEARRRERQWEYSREIVRQPMQATPYDLASAPDQTVTTRVVQRPPRRVEELRISDYIMDDFMSSNELREVTRNPRGVPFAFYRRLADMVGGRIPEGFIHVYVERDIMRRECRIAFSDQPWN